MIFIKQYKDHYIKQIKMNKPLKKVALINFRINFQSKKEIENSFYNNKETKRKTLGAHYVMGTQSFLNQFKNKDEDNNLMDFGMEGQPI